MLSQLHIKNIAVIKDINIEFENGFSVLTGETGAGKSIIIDAINMILGERTTKDLIRNGEEKASVSAGFIIDNKDLTDFLEENGIEVTDNEVIISRTINTDGKSSCRINGMMASATMLKEIAKYLINIHGQHDNQSLLNPKGHILFLDSFCKNDALKQEYFAIWQKTKEIEKQIDEFTFDEKEKERRTDILQFEINEIESAKLDNPNEEDELSLRRDFLGGISKITSCVENAKKVLYNGNGNVHDCLSGVCDDFSSISSYDKALAEIYERLNSTSIELDDIIYTISDFSSNLDFNPSELDNIEDRLNTISHLKKKYGYDIPTILEYYEKIKEELNKITANDEIINELEKKLEKSRNELIKKAEELTKNRKENAIKLEKLIKEQLKDLEMKNTEFKVDIVSGNFNKDGADNIEFLISANLGENLKPLSKIASGGEMSRIMLAIKSILSDADIVETLIFDEIDTGVSGIAAQKIAEKINLLSKKKQILCITHLAQIASIADNQYLIKKQVVNNETVTSVENIKGEERILEIARIIGGAKITETTMLAAKEMLTNNQ